MNKVRFHTVELYSTIGQRLTLNFENWWLQNLPTDQHTFWRNWQIDPISGCRSRPPPLNKRVKCVLMFFNFIFSGFLKLRAHFKCDDGNQSIIHIGSNDADSAKKTIFRGFVTIRQHEGCYRLKYSKILDRNKDFQCQRLGDKLLALYLSSA